MQRESKKKAEKAVHQVEPVFFFSAYSVSFYRIRVNRCSSVS